jgi:hypothetical protein
MRKIKSDAIILPENVDYNQMMRMMPSLLYTHPACDTIAGRKELLSVQEPFKKFIEN